MYVVDTGLPWHEHPYLYSQEGEVDSDSAIEAIEAAGFGEVFIDTERGLQIHASGGGQDALGRLLAEPGPGSPSRQVALDEELATASTVYADCLRIAHGVLNDVKAGGDVDVEASGVVVDSIIASAVRNPDALLALSKLRRHDAYTFTHGVNVGVLAVAFGCSLGFGPEELKELGLAGLFHDVGKTGISDAILNKPGRLTDEEFERIKAHPDLGVLLLAGHGLSDGVLRGVGEHHEKQNGHGYPKGLSGQDVHPWGAIVGVADVYDALTSRRSYKDPMLPTRALGVLYSLRGKEFRPELVERFIKFMGPYPVGTFVRLENGLFGVVSASNPARPLLPEVLVVLAPDRLPLAPWRMRLQDGGEQAASPIVEALDPKAYGVDPLALLAGAGVVSHG